VVLAANTQTNRTSNLETREQRYRARQFGYTKPSPLTRTSLKAMKNKSDPADSSLSETMAARIEIKELGDPVHQKKITDAVEALDGVIETKIEKGALRVSYNPLATTEKKIEQAIRSTGTTIKAAATDTEGAHPDLPKPNVQQASVQNADEGEHS
jgi:copper chaperone CopZ